MAITPLAANQSLLPDASSARGARFIIERPLSAGGFAITYLAWDQQLRDRCVIKELAISEIMGRSGNAMVALPGRDADLAIWVQKVQREAEILHSLRTVGVVPVRATWRENGTAYFAMDFVDGIELPRQPIDGVRWETWEPVARRFLRALGAIHAAGLVHGDIKPQNVLVRKDGTPVIIDFGTARSSEDARKTRLTTIAMTPGYCPPELAVRDRAKEMGPWSDLYSWSLTVMGLVIQHRGIEGAPLEATARVALSQHGIRDAGIGEETSAALKAAGLPDRWVQALMACASLYPASRPASVEAVLALLDGSPNASVNDARRASAPPPLPASPAGEARRAVHDLAIDDGADLPPEQPTGGRWKWIAAAGLLIAAGAAAYFVATRPVCGNGKVEEGEGCATCPQDIVCGPLTECVDDQCTSTCGNGRPDQGETCSNCPAEITCAASEFCDETTHACKLKCGNGVIDAGESCKSCPQDAGCCAGTWMEDAKCAKCPDGFTLVKAGEFTMGASAREIQRWGEQYPYLEPLPSAQRGR
ncbi:MAG: serine/threonine protein kinase, partial [Deltaproteobacteria bacterium]|nr:serine/threonine protein kinase [Deltaproteobacteria bacterium]